MRMSNEGQEMRDMREGLERSLKIFERFAEKENGKGNKMSNTTAISGGASRAQSLISIPGSISRLGTSDEGVIKASTAPTISR